MRLQHDQYVACWIFNFGDVLWVQSVVLLPRGGWHYRMRIGPQATMPSHGLFFILRYTNVWQTMRNASNCVQCSYYSTSFKSRKNQNYLITTSIRHLWISAASRSILFEWCCWRSPQLQSLKQNKWIIFIDGPRRFCVVLFSQRFGCKGADDLS